MSDTRSEAADWFRRRTSRAADEDAAALADARTDRVSVVLPARDESATIGTIVTALRRELIEQVGLVDEVLVVDSRSGDGTGSRALDAGAVVHRVEAHGRDGGKGEALRAGLAHMSGDVGVFLDADVVDFDPTIVAGLIGPLLRDPELVLVKGFYDRPWSGEGARAIGGGRVTELVARPLIRRMEPRLSGLAQPLAGECAFRREPLLRLPFVSGYGVEMGLLLQVLDTHGLDALAQSDLGVRVHSHQDLDALARMAVQVESAVTLCRDGTRDHLEEFRTVFARSAGGTMEMHRERVHTWLLPPLSRPSRRDAGR